jgi:hypothetical protein
MTCTRTHPHALTRTLARSLLHHVRPVLPVSYPALTDFTEVDDNGVRTAVAGEYTVSFGLEESSALGMGYAVHKLTAL